MHSDTYYKGPFTQVRPQYIVVRAPSVKENWYKNWVYPNIYDHYWTMAWNGIWSDEERNDKFEFLFGWPSFYNYSNEQRSVQYVSPAHSKLTITSAPSSPLFNLFTWFGRATYFGGNKYTLKLAYKHTNWIPDDYTAVWFKSHMIMLDYSRGATNEEDSYLYGKDDWINNNAGWLNYFNGMYIGDFAKTYHLIDHGNYKIYFVQGEKYKEMIPIGLPWVSQSFLYGDSFIAPRLLGNPSDVIKILGGDKSLKPIKKNNIKLRRF